MLIKFNIELNRRPDTKGRWSVMIRMHQKGQKPGRVLTSVRIENAPKFWNPKKPWRKWVVKHSAKDSLNEEILNEHNRIKRQVEEWQKAEMPGAILTPQQLAERFRAGTSDKYFEWVDKVLEDAKDQAYATFIAKRTATNGLREWAGENLPLLSVSPIFVRNYQDHLKKTPMENGERRKASSVNKYLKLLHTIHKAILIKTGISEKKAEFLSPWNEVAMLAELKPKKAKLNETVIEKVASIQVRTKRRRVTPESAFHLWMLARVLAGIRFSDILFLRYSNFQVDAEGKPIHLRYEMLKTGNVISIPILEEGKTLLQYYWKSKASTTDFILPYLDNKAIFAKIFTHEDYKRASFAVKRRLYNDLAHWNRQVNLCLKEIQEEAGLTEKLRTHNARHSFADLARRIMQQDGSLTMYDIQKMMGHSSYKTTEIYTTELGEGDSTQAMNAIFDRHKR